MWDTVSTGILLAGVGVFLLLTTLGTVPGTFWLALIPFWPVLLVSLGIKLIFERSSLPYLTLLGPVLVLATMAYVATTRPARSAGTWMPIAVARAEGVNRLRLTGDVHMATLNMKSNPALAGTGLLEGRAAVDDEDMAATSVYDRGSEARVNLGRRGRDGRHSVRFYGPWALGRYEWDLGVAPDLPLSVDLDMAGTTGEIDLHDVDVREIRLEGAFNDLDLHLGPPSGNTRIVLEGAFQRLDVHVPRNVRVLYGEDGFMNSVHRRASRPRNDDPVYRLFVDGAFNRVGVRND